MPRIRGSEIRKFIFFFSILHQFVCADVYADKYEHQSPCQKLRILQPLNGTRIILRSLSQKQTPDKAQLPVLCVSSRPGAMIHIQVNGQSWLERRASRAGILSVQLPRTSQGWQKIQVDLLDEELDGASPVGEVQCPHEIAVSPAAVWVCVGAEEDCEDTGTSAFRILHPLTGWFPNILSCQCSLL
jgi:hypothetical protein